MRLRVRGTTARRRTHSWSLLPRSEQQTLVKHCALERAVRISFFVDKKEAPKRVFFSCSVHLYIILVLLVLVPETYSHSFLENYIIIYCGINVLSF